MPLPKRAVRSRSAYHTASSKFKFFMVLIVDRAIAIGYTPISANCGKHFPTTRDGLDAIPSKDRPACDRMGSCASADGLRCLAASFSKAD